MLTSGLRGETERETEVETETDKDTHTEQHNSVAQESPGRAEGGE